MAVISLCANQGCGKRQPFPQGIDRRPRFLRQPRPLRPYRVDGETHLSAGRQHLLQCPIGKRLRHQPVRQPGDAHPLLHCRRDGGKIILYQPRLRTEAHVALLRVIQLPFLQLAVVQIAEGTVLVQPGNSLRRWLLAQVLRRRAQHHAVLSQRPGPQRPGIGQAPDTHRKIKPLLQQIDLPVAVVELELQ